MGKFRCSLPENVDAFGFKGTKMRKNLHDGNVGSMNYAFVGLSPVYDGEPWGPYVAFARKLRQAPSKRS